jgi:glutaredoxin 3
MDAVELYTRDGCGLCDQTKRLLSENKVDYREYVIGLDIDRDEIITRFPDARLLPIVVVDGAWIGGRDEVLSLLSQEKRNAD